MNTIPPKNEPPLNLAGGVGVVDGLVVGLGVDGVVGAGVGEAVVGSTGCGVVSGGVTVVVTLAGTGGATVVTLTVAAAWFIQVNFNSIFNYAYLW